MSLSNWRKINTLVNSEEVQGEIAKVELDGRSCPTCRRSYPKSTGLIVCSKDGTLLIPDDIFAAIVEDRKTFGLANNRYQIEMYVGEGDLTNVYHATDTTTNEKVAVKVIKTKMLGEPKRVRKAADTLQETIKLRHPNIVSVLESGITKGCGNGPSRVYYVVEKLKASMNLKAILRHHGPMAPYMVVETMIKVSETLDCAANIGWLHEDLKPSNIYISMNEEQVAVKIADFGVAERMFRNLEWESKGTKTGSLYGNAAYTAPDVFSGQGKTVPAEIYSLACVMYHVLKGMPPFEANNDFGTLMMHRDKEPKPFAAELKIPSELEAVVMKCLNKKPEDRYQSFNELATDLNGIK
jgi:eukaryotic-like serine/threonine-protein kinase